MHLDHLYRETTNWDESVAFWERLGFGFVEQWGAIPHRAGTLRNGTATIVLAEVGGDQIPAATTFLSVLDVEDLASVTGVPVTETHWGTRMATLIDPDGRTYHFEPREDA